MHRHGAPLQLPSHEQRRSGGPLGARHGRNRPSCGFSVSLSRPAGAIPVGDDDDAADALLAAGSGAGTPPASPAPPLGRPVPQVTVEEEALQPGGAVAVGAAIFLREGGRGRGGQRKGGVVASLGEGDGGGGRAARRRAAEVARRGTTLPLVGAPVLFAFAATAVAAAVVKLAQFLLPIQGEKLCPTAVVVVPLAASPSDRGLAVSPCVIGCDVGSDGRTGRGNTTSYDQGCFAGDLFMVHGGEVKQPMDVSCTGFRSTVAGMFLGKRRLKRRRRGSGFSLETARGLRE